jgi:hypothetical protein
MIISLLILYFFLGMETLLIMLARAEPKGYFEVIAYLIIAIFLWTIVWLTKMINRNPR